MIEVTFIQKDTDEKETIQVPENTTLMEASRFYSKNMYIRGIEGDCGGSCSCATCHVHVSKEWKEVTGPASDKTAELSLLEYETNFIDDNTSDMISRLSCQILLKKKHNGLVVYVP
jgi:2Fe-2S ferredoxin